MTLITAADIARVLNPEQPRIPTEEQRAVIESDLGTMLVVAGAGSGKTHTMAMRVLYLVANGIVSPDRVLGLTFTNKAAGELRDRLRDNLSRLRKAGLIEGSDGIDAPQPQVLTYNAYAGMIVKNYGHLLGFRPDQRLIGEAELQQLAREIVAGASANEYPKLAEDPPADLEGQVTATMAGLANFYMPDLPITDPTAELAVAAPIRQIQRDLEDIAATLGSSAATRIREFTDRLERRNELLRMGGYLAALKRKRGLYDFSDQLTVATKLVHEFPDLVRREAGLFDAVLLDEFQDTSAIQLELLGTLFGNSNVTAVGDPRQAIYGWRGASSASLELFTQRFGLKDGVETKSLSTSWRNDRSILEVANVVARKLPEVRSSGQSSVPVTTLDASPLAKEGLVQVAACANPSDEAKSVVSWIKLLRRQDSHTTSAVLCRTKAQMQPIIEECVRQEVPYEVVSKGGLLSVPVVSDLVAALHVASDASDDRPLVRLLDKWCISPADIHALKNVIKRDREALDPASLIDVINDHLPEVEGLSKVARSRLGLLAGQLAQIRFTAAESLPSRVWAAVRAMNLDIEAAANPLDKQSGRNLGLFLRQVEDYASANPTHGLRDFLSWLERAEAKEEGLPQFTQPSPGAVTIITVHSAKGMEWDVVAVPGLIEGKLPSRNSFRVLKKEYEQGFPNEHVSFAGWLKDATELPYPLRNDAEFLPRLDLARGQEGLKEYMQALGDLELDSERRLAYVAFTRARSSLLLSYTVGVTDDGFKPRLRSRYLNELEALGMLPPVLALGQRTYDPETAQQIAEREGARPCEVLYWPTPSENYERAAHALELAHGEAQPLSEADSFEMEDLRWQAALLTTEFKRSQEILLDHVNATRLPALVVDPDEFALQMRRPMPPQQGEAANLGVLFHNWAQSELEGQGTMLDLPDLELPEKQWKQLSQWQHAFRQIDFGEFRFVGAERLYRTRVEGISVVCRIDAIFKEPTTGKVLLIDWKTGRPPTDASARFAFATQLTTYKLAYAQSEGVDPSNVEAQLVFVSSRAKRVGLSELDPRGEVAHDLQNALGALG